VNLQEEHTQKFKAEMILAEAKLVELNTVEESKNDTIDNETKCTKPTEVDKASYGHQSNRENIHLATDRTDLSIYFN
jgi:hypothetical protein